MTQLAQMTQLIQMIQLNWMTQTTQLAQMTQMIQKIQPAKLTQTAWPSTNAGILLSKHSLFTKLSSCHAITQFTNVISLTGIPGHIFINRYTRI